jgi:hypothetical protein
MLEWAEERTLKFQWAEMPLPFIFGLTPKKLFIEKRSF